MQVNISNEIASQANLTVIVLKKYWFHLDNSVSQGYIGKQPSSVVLRKRCFENMQQIYRETPMLKRDFNKVAKQLYWNRTSVWVFPVNLQHIFRTPFLKNTSDELLFYILVFVLTLLDLRVLKVFFHITGKSHSNFQTFEEVKDSFSYQCSHLFQCFPVFRRSLSIPPENLWFSDVFRGMEMELQNNEKHWNK